MGCRVRRCGDAGLREESPSDEFIRSVRYSRQTLKIRFFARFDKQRLVPEWLKALWRHQWMFFLVVFSLCFKLQLSYQTIGTRLGQVPFLTYLEFCWQALDAWLPSIFLMGSYVTHFGWVIVLTGWTLLLGERHKRIALLAIDVGVTVLIFADTVYFRYFRDLISPVTLLQFGMVGELREAIGQLVQTGDLLFLADFALLAVARARFRPWRLPQTEPWLRRSVQAAVVSLLGWQLLIVGMDRQLNGERDFHRFDWSSGVLLSNVGLLPFHAIRLANFIGEQWNKTPLSPEEIAQIGEWFDNRKGQRKGPEGLEGIARGKNVIIVQMESFQNFVIGRTLHGKGITPNLNALAKDSLYFPNFYHQTGLGRTSNAELASNCSLLHLRAGSAYVQYPTHTYDCVSSTLREAGYSTMVLHGNDPALYRRVHVYGPLGFDRFYSVNDFKLTQKVGMGLGDVDLFAQSMDFLAQTKKPFYAYYITLTSHVPYFSVRTAIPAELDGNGGLYDYLEAVHYLDRGVGQLVASLKARGLWDESVVVLFGDHDNDRRTRRSDGALHGSPRA